MTTIATPDFPPKKLVQLFSSTAFVWIPKCLLSANLKTVWFEGSGVHSLFSVCNSTEYWVGMYRGEPLSCHKMHEPVSPDQFRGHINSWLSYLCRTVCNPSSRLHWVVQVPVDMEQTFYVWVENIELCQKGDEVIIWEVLSLSIFQKICILLQRKILGHKFQQLCISVMAESRENARMKNAFLAVAITEIARYSALENVNQYNSFICLVNLSKFLKRLS